MTAQPWDDEPDSFYLTASGLPARGHRHEFYGNWCGYVGVPKSHPLYGKHFRHAVPHPAGFMERPLAINEVGALGLLGAMLAHKTWPEGHASISLIITAHGGLTWADRFSDDPEHWYFGFDCGHAGDLQPGMLGGHADVEWYRNMKVYRTMEYVQGECLHLAEQLADYGKEATDEAVGKQAKHHE